MLIAPIPLPPDPTELTSTSLAGGRPARPRIVILGGGFAGVAAVRALARTEADVVLVDRHNDRTLQPLLPAVAAGRLLRSAARAPLASLLGGQRNARLVRGEVRGIDKAGRTVRVGDRDLPYDFLVVATGARARPNQGESMLPLETATDAATIRARIRGALERAQRAADAAERQRLMTFVVVGAGPTGVALAGAVAGAVRQALASEFGGLDPEAAKVVLVEAAIRVLPGIAKGLSGVARRTLQGLGVELRLGVPVTGCDEQGIVLAGKRLPSATVLWAGGVTASPAAQWLDAASDRDGRVLVAPDLSLPGHPEIFVVGDAAHVVQDGEPLPGLAAVAHREGDYAARAIAARIAGKRVPEPFRCRATRMLAPIGGSFAIGQFGPLQVWGRLGWLAWAAVQVPSLIGFRHALPVMLGRLGTAVAPSRHRASRVPPVTSSLRAKNA